MTVQADLDLALSLADRADVITMARFGALDLHVEEKPDLTPVSDADVAVETELRTILDAERPGEDVLPDELRLDNGDSAMRAPGGRVYSTPDQVRSERILLAATSARDGAALTLPAAAGRHRPRPQPVRQRPRHRRRQGVQAA